MTWYNWLSVGDYLNYQRIHHHNHYTIDHHHQLATMDYHFSIHRTTSLYATTFRRLFSHRTIEGGALKLFSRKPWATIISPPSVCHKNYYKEQKKPFITIWDYAASAFFPSTTSRLPCEDYERGATIQQQGQDNCVLHPGLRGR